MLTGEEPDQTRPKLPLWGWPPTPRMQIYMIVGVCVLINLVLLGIWVLVVLTR